MIAKVYRQKQFLEFQTKLKASKIRKNVRRSLRPLHAFLMNFLLQVTAVLALVGVALSAPSDPYGPPAHQPVYKEVSPICLCTLYRA